MTSAMAMTMSAVLKYSFPVHYVISVVLVTVTPQHFVCRITLAAIVPNSLLEKRLRPVDIGAVTAMATAAGRFLGTLLAVSATTALDFGLLGERSLDVVLGV